MNQDKKTVLLLPEDGRRGRKRPDYVSDQIKMWIMDQGLTSGDRLPQEKDLIDIFGVSKGTIREALKALEVQGLIRTRTGPGGGAFIDLVSDRRAIELLGNYFFSKDVSIGDIYQLRKLLEPELAASIVGLLKEEDFERLENTMRIYSHAPQNIEEEREQRMAELDFHGVLADVCPNAILSFVCRYLQSQLKSLAVCRKIYEMPHPELRRRGRDYQTELLDALRMGDRDRAKLVMYEHMCEAERLMVEWETVIENRFFRDEDF